MIWVHILKIWSPITSFNEASRRNVSVINLNLMFQSNINLWTCETIWFICIVVKDLWGNSWWKPRFPQSGSLPMSPYWEINIIPTQSHQIGESGKDGLFNYRMQNAVNYTCKQRSYLHASKDSHFFLVATENVRINLHLILCNPRTWHCKNNCSSQKPHKWVFSPGH